MDIEYAGKLLVRDYNQSTCYKGDYSKYIFHNNHVNTAKSMQVTVKTYQLRECYTDLIMYTCTVTFTRAFKGKIYIDNEGFK